MFFTQLKTCTENRPRFRAGGQGRNPGFNFRDQKGIPDTLEVLSNVDSSRENFVDRSAVAALRATTINLQFSLL